MNPVDLPPPAAPSLAPGPVMATTPPGLRAGPVDAESVVLLRLPELEESPEYRQMTARLQASEEIVESLGRHGPVARDQLLTSALDDLVGDGKIDGLIVGSADGFVVAQSSSLAQAELLAVVGSAFEFAARRLQSEHLVDSVEELSARGRNGEQVVMRYFPGPDSEFFLLAYSRQPATYRRTMARALRRCAEILHDPAPRPRSRRSPSRPVSPVPVGSIDASPTMPPEPPPAVNDPGPSIVPSFESGDLPAPADEVAVNPNQPSQ